LADASTNGSAFDIFSGIFVDIIDENEWRIYIALREKRRKEMKKRGERDKMK
jgi:hypothetical protein